MGFPRWTGWLVPALIAGCAQPSPQPADTSADVAAINAVRDHEAALAGLGNADSMMAVYSADVVMMPPGEPIVEGIEAAKRWAEATFAGASLTVNYISSQVTVSGDWAVDRYTGSLTITPKAGAAAMNEEIKGVHIMRKEADGSWKIAIDVWNPNTPPAPPAGAKP